MYRTRITIDPYGVSSAWVCPVCEQEKSRPEAAEYEQSSNKKWRTEL